MSETVKEKRNLADCLNAAPIQELGILDVKRHIPHRYPFLFVDKVSILEEGKLAVGTKCVTVNEPFFQGHFPEQPIMPAVLMVEAISQVGAVLLNTLPHYSEKIGFMLNIEEARFRTPVVPGDTLKIAVEILRCGGRAGKMRGEVYSAGRLCAEAVTSFVISDRPKQGENK